MNSSENQKKSLGFSLIEVLIVIVIAALLAALAGPSFIASTQRFRSLAEINSFVGDLQFARSEAVKQGLPVTLCTSSDGITCLTNGNWHTGWIIFTDAASNQTPCNTCVLRKQKRWDGTDTLIASNTTAAITFNRDGFRAFPSSSTGQITLTLHTSPLNNNATQCITLSQTGRQATLPFGTGCT